MTDTDTAFSMDDLVSLCKRRGFIYPASEIYGGLNGFWDYGPLGTELKNNLRDAWWHDMVRCPPNGPDGEPISISPPFRRSFGDKMLFPHQMCDVLPLRGAVAQCGW